VRKNRKSPPSGSGTTRPGGRSPRWLRLVISGTLALVLLLLLVLAVAPVRVRLQVALGMPIAIADLQQRAFLRGERVTVEGEVIDRAPLIGGQIMELQDSSGSVWVVSSDTTRQPGESARIRGDVQVEEFGTEAIPAEAIPAEVYLIEYLPNQTSPLPLP